ncbi:cytochrome c oxidase assembly protein [Corallincola holothuriorum]|uniref:Cytochrome c oxidase assembly protein CtaG n=1 Tax=Corallincola holothuriorum TaxID=2282215 RepID=A0A368NMJ9_9GAMM|nr:cytochrome c oxidase assembly protein [Corallincola holothuriorum]RCU51113.1 cytochrome c oxidase assembly protein [Corallincola holothuriorum]
MSEQKAAVSHKPLLWRLGFAVLGMFGFAFALVPLYDVFCDLTGLNGRTSGEVAVYDGPIVDTSRLVTIEFIARTQGSMPWRFEPVVRRMAVHPGELHIAEFEVQNLTSTQMVGQAVPSVSPGTLATYLNKTECFCFNQQPLAAGETKALPLRFFIDNDIPDDVTTLTLSYTLFDITESLAGGASASTSR